MKPNGQVTKDITKKDERSNAGNVAERDMDTICSSKEFALVVKGKELTLSITGKL